MANYESLTEDAKNYLAEQYAKALSHALDPEVMGFTEDSWFLGICFQYQDFQLEPEQMKRP